MSDLIPSAWNIHVFYLWAAKSMISPTQAILECTVKYMVFLKLETYLLNIFSDYKLFFL